MRVVGYVRERPGSDNGESAYAQSERIRRWAGREGHAVMAVCQDIPQAGYPIDRSGYRALLSIIDAGRIDTVVLATLGALSPDKIIQEVMLWDLRSRGVSVLAVDDREEAGPSHDHARLLIRDVLARVAEYGVEVAEEAPRHTFSRSPSTPSELPEVIVELVPHEEVS